MGAAESRENQSTNNGGGSSSNPRRNPNDDSEIPKSLAVAGAVGAAVGAGLLAWKMSHSAATATGYSSSQHKYHDDDDDDRALAYHNRFKLEGATSQGVSQSPLTYGTPNPVEDDDDEEWEANSGPTRIFEWNPPPVGVFMLNTDGSHIQGVCGSAGGIIRDSHGEPIIAFALAFPEENVLVHELQAILEGLKLAHERRNRFRQIVVATDSKSAKDFLTNAAHTGKYPREKLARVNALVMEIEGFRKGFVSCDVIWVPREMNRVANRFAKMECRDLKIGEMRTELYPPQFSAPAWELIRKDAASAGFSLM